MKSLGGYQVDDCVPNVHGVVFIGVAPVEIRRGDFPAFAYLCFDTFFVVVGLIVVVVRGLPTRPGTQPAVDLLFGIHTSAFVTT